MNYRKFKGSINDVFAKGKRQAFYNAVVEVVETSLNESFNSKKTSDPFLIVHATHEGGETTCDLNLADLKARCPNVEFMKEVDADYESPDFKGLFLHCNKNRYLLTIAKI